MSKKRTNAERKRRKAARAKVTRKSRGATLVASDASKILRDHYAEHLRQAVSADLPILRAGWAVGPIEDHTIVTSTNAIYTYPPEAS